LFSLFCKAAAPPGGGGLNGYQLASLMCIPEEKKCLCLAAKLANGIISLYLEGRSSNGREEKMKAIGLPQLANLKAEIEAC